MGVDDEGLADFLQARLDHMASEARRFATDRDPDPWREEIVRDAMVDINAQRDVVEQWRRAARRSHASQVEEAYADGLAMAMAMLARKWGDHQDYRVEWRP